MIHATCDATDNIVCLEFDATPPFPHPKARGSRHLEG